MRQCNLVGLDVERHHDIMKEHIPSETAVGTRHESSVKEGTHKIKMALGFDGSPPS